MQTQSEHYFGACPKCGDQGGFMNVGRSHWVVCDEHQTKWCAGSNLFSSWQDETEDTWRENAAKLEGYEEVEPMPWEPTAEEKAERDRQIAESKNQPPAEIEDDDFPF
jgi:ssDNA-binding Zn-finger/Zn-ribbon topoisomerase 1